MQLEFATEGTGQKQQIFHYILILPHDYCPDANAKNLARRILDMIASCLCAEVGYAGSRRAFNAALTLHLHSSLGYIHIRLSTSVTSRKQEGAAV